MRRLCCCSHYVFNRNASRNSVAEQWRHLLSAVDVCRHSLIDFCMLQNSKRRSYNSDGSPSTWCTLRRWATACLNRLHNWNLNFGTCKNAQCTACQHMRPLHTLSKIFGAQLIVRLICNRSFPYDCRIGLYFLCLSTAARKVSTRPEKTLPEL